MLLLGTLLLTKLWGGCGYNEFQRLDEQPLLMGYEVDEGWQDTNAAGCIDQRIRTEHTQHW
jgi:hypothetical protein